MEQTAPACPLGLRRQISALLAAGSFPVRFWWLYLLTNIPDEELRALYTEDYFHG
jgi:hypothetical protein